NRLVGGEFLKAFAHPIDDGGTEDVERAGVADGQAHDAVRVARDAAIMIEHFHQQFSPFSPWTLSSSRQLVFRRVYSQKTGYSAYWRINTAAFAGGSCYYMIINIP